MKKYSAIDIKNTFFTGLALLAPIAITLWILTFTLNFLDNFLGRFIYPIIGRQVWGLGIILTIGFIFMIGYLARNIVGNSIINYLEDLFKRLPLVKNIYSSTKQVVDAFFLGGGMESFKKVVMIEYPRKGIYTLGFMTRENISGVVNVGKHLSSVFIPTTPNPTSGFFLMIPRDEITVLNISVEDGIKLIVSAGMISVEQLGNEVEVIKPQKKGFWG